MRHHHCGTSSSRMFSPPQFHRGALLSPTFCCLPSPAPVLQSVFPMASRVSLFVTCVVDQLFPKVGMAVVDVLEHLGFNVDFPERQTCCGQPAFNSGFREEARHVARHFLDVFADSDYIVVPFVRVFRWFDALERGWTDLLTGEASRESDQVQPYSGQIEELS